MGKVREFKKLAKRVGRVAAREALVAANELAAKQLEASKPKTKKTKVESNEKAD